MKLSNTMMMNESLLPTGKKAFTLAEVLITLSILGVVAALTIPSLVNRQSDLAAQVKLKKAISNFEDVVGVYMAENEATDITDIKCSEMSDYFKVVTGPSAGTNKCDFTTADGVAWSFQTNGSTAASTLTGLATATDSKTGPRYAVAMWATNGQANGLKASDTQATAPATLYTTLNVDSGVDLINARKISTPNLFLQGTYACTAAPTVTQDATTKDTTITCTKKDN